MTPIANSSFSDVTALPYRSPERHLAYGQDALQFAEAWSTPDDTDADTLLMIHGGCWLNAYDLTHVRPFCAALADRGINVWSMEYRRVGDAGGGWPGTFEDIIAGIRAVHAAETPPGGRLIIAGHSAGGHLALWAATRFRTTSQSSDNPLQINRVIGLAAISDLEAYAGGNSPCELAARSLMDGTPAEQPERYRKASPITLPAALDTILIHGQQDTIVPNDQSRRYCARTGARHTIIKQANHFDLVHPGSIAFETIVHAVMHRE